MGSRHEWSLGLIRALGLFRGLGDSGFRAVTKTGDCAIPSDENISTANDNAISHGLTRHLEQLLELNLERRAQSK